MRRLMLLRHAKTERAEPGDRDRDRKLMKRGRADAPIVGAYLAHHGLAPDLALVSPAERARRAEALRGIVRELELDVLLLAGADYRGHKGTLRWVADYNLAHRYGYAVVPPDDEPELLLPLNLAAGRDGGWNAKVRYARDLLADPSSHRGPSCGAVRNTDKFGVDALQCEDCLLCLLGILTPGCGIHRRASTSSWTACLAPASRRNGRRERRRSRTRRRRRSQRRRRSTIGSSGAERDPPLRPSIY